MHARYDKLLLLVSVIGSAIVLVLFLPLPGILELVFVSLLLLLLLLAISAVYDQLHLHQTRQQWRSIHLQRLKNSFSFNHNRRWPRP